VIAVMEDGKTVEIPIERAAEVEIIKTSTDAVPGAEDPDGVQRLDGAEKSAVLKEEFITGEYLKTGEEIEVDALEYTSKGDKEDITIILNGKKQKVKKAFVEVK
jgi:hypothetical protein